MIYLSIYLSASPPKVNHSRGRHPFPRLSLILFTEWQTERSRNLHVVGRGKNNNTSESQMPVLFLAYSWQVTTHQHRTTVWWIAISWFNYCTLVMVSLVDVCERRCFWMHWVLLCVGSVKMAVKDKWQMSMLSWPKLCGRASIDPLHQKIYELVHRAEFVCDYRWVR